MRAEALLVLLLAAPAAAQDAGARASFAGKSALSFAVAPGAAGRAVFESEESAPLAEEWDTLLLHGVLPDPAVRFELARGGDWVPFETHRYSDGRFWAKARVPRGAGSLRLRAIDGGVRAAHVVDIFAVEAFLEGEEPPARAEPPARPPADPSAERPRVHPRASWNAARPKEPWSPDPRPWRVTLHHSDGRRTETLEETLREARFIQDFHMRGRGWIDIAYHFLIDAAGNIVEGRPEGAAGAHTLANNEGNVGVVLLGKHHPPRRDPATPEQLAALRALMRYLAQRHGLEPSSLKGHRDYRSTDCPGDTAYAQLPALRRELSRPAPGLIARRLARALIDSDGLLDWDQRPPRDRTSRASAQR